MEEEPQAAIDIHEHAAVDVESLATALNIELGSLQPLSDEYNSIYRVPKRLRELNEKAYTPQVVSIGPLHHGKTKLIPMEEHKRRYLQDFLRRTEQVGIEEYIALIKANEQRLRNSYAEDIKLSSDEFIKMILVDAAFIIEILLRSTFSNLQSRNDRIFTKPWMIADIMFDLCLLENQLPFFILDYMFMTSNIPLSWKNDRYPPIIRLIHGFTKDSWDFSEINDHSLENKSFDKVEHLVDFLSICLVPPDSKRTEKTKLKTLTTPSVTKLHQAGVKFKKSDSQSMFDIRFHQGCMEIPKLKIVKETELLFRNLLAFEQCHGSSNCVNDFIVLINHLVNTPKDVDFLIHFGIIENWLWDSDGVSTLFHNLVKETSIMPENFYFSGTVEAMNDYCRTPWHNWKATLKQDYFKNPWAGISVFAAIVLLALTCIQTVYAVLKQ